MTIMFHNPIESAQALTFSPVYAKLLHRAATSPSLANAMPTVVQDMLRSPDEPLNAQMCACMESHFGHDFSGVQVRPGENRSKSVRPENTFTYTMGSVSQNAGPRDAGVPSRDASIAIPQSSSATAPHPKPRACITNERIPDNQTSFQIFQGHAADHFEMNIDWNNTDSECECRCGEYRQFVKGHININGKKQPKLLWGGATLEENVYHEDGDGTTRYGHRNEAETSIDRFIGPDRATGCSYRGRDMPGLEAPSGTRLDMSLTFKGQTYDVCQNKFGQIHEWKVEFDDFLP
jgi:hypothetical protein